MKKILTLSFIFMGICAYAQKATLVLNLKKDSTYYLSTNATLDIDEQMANNDILVKTTISGVTSHKITAIDDTIYTMQVAYKSLHMSMQAGANKMDFGSDGDTSNIFSKMFKLITGKPFYMTMSKYGRILEIKGLEEVLTSMANGMTSISPEQKAQVMAQMKQTLNAVSLKSQLQEAFIIFPKHAVELHGAWVNNNILNAAAVSARTETTYTLDNISADSYDISGKAIMTPADKDPAFKQSAQVYLRLIDIDGTCTTTLKMDKATGWILASKVEKHVKANAEVKQTADGPVAMKFPMTIDSSIAGTGH